MRFVILAILSVCLVASEAGARQSPSAPHEATPLPGASEGEAALARGLALLGDGDTAAAREQLDRALADPKLSPPLRFVALNNSIQADRKAAEGVTGDQQDIIFAGVLAKARQWKKLNSDSPRARVLVAQTLAALGGYEAALGENREIYILWPAERYWATMRISDITRTLNQDERGLAALDKLVAESGPQRGMSFHYHRGRALTRLGRYPEAIAEFDSGLIDQPGYGWAYISRACAKALSGRLTDAVADQRFGIELLNAGLDKSPMPPAVEASRQRAMVVLQAFTDADARHDRAADKALCEGYLGDSRRREPSRLLTMD